MRWVRCFATRTESNEANQHEGRCDDAWRIIDWRAMLSAEAIQYIRSMTPDEKWRNMFAAIESAWKRISSLPAVEQEKLIAYIRKRHELSNRLMIERIRKFG